MINCPYCGKLTDPKLGNCPHCGGPMHPKAPAPQAQRQPAPQRCPNCNAPIQEGDIICLRCGTNLLTGHKIAEEQKQVIAEERRSMTPVLLGIILVALLVGGGLLVYLLLRPTPVAEAQKLLDEQRYLEAIDLLAAHVDQEPTDAAAQTLLGRARLAANQYAPAADAFEAAFSQPGSNVEPGLLAVAALARAQGQPIGRQVKILRDVTQRDPANGRAWHLLGLALQVSGDAPGAVEAFSRAADLGTLDADTQKQLGIARALQTEYDAAQADLAQAQNLSPESGDVQAALGALNGMQGAEDAAKPYWEAALTNGTSVRQLAQLRLALIYLDQGNFGAAAPLLEQAALGADAVPSADFYKAIGQQLAGQNAEAIGTFEKVASANGEMREEASALLAALYLDTGDLPRAREALGKAAGAPPAMVKTLEGRIALAEGDEPGAQAALQAAVAADGQYASAHLELGLLYIRRGALNEGLRELERYLEIAHASGESAGVNQIEVLVDQLRQTSEAPQAVAGAGA